jgi:hypothetical protein
LPALGRLLLLSGRSPFRSGRTNEQQQRKRKSASAVVV